MPGSGLGLAIVRQTAEAHGGWVRGRQRARTAAPSCASSSVRLTERWKGLRYESQTNRRRRGRQRPRRRRCRRCDRRHLQRRGQGDRGEDPRRRRQDAEHDAGEAARRARRRRGRPARPGGQGRQPHAGAGRRDQEAAAESGRVLGIPHGTVGQGPRRSACASAAVLPAARSPTSPSALGITERQLFNRLRGRQVDRRDRQGRGQVRSPTSRPPSARRRRSSSTPRSRTESSRRRRPTRCSRTSTSRIDDLGDRPILRRGPALPGQAPGVGPITDLADALGITERQLFTRLRSGKTIAEIAKAEGKSLADVKASVRAAEKKRLDAAVKDRPPHPGAGRRDPLPHRRAARPPRGGRLPPRPPPRPAAVRPARSAGAPGGREPLSGAEHSATTSDFAHVVAVDSAWW